MLKLNNNYPSEIGAGGNGTAGTAMAVPLFEGGKKWCLGFYLMHGMWNSLPQWFVMAWVM